MPFTTGSHFVLSVFLFQRFLIGRLQRLQQGELGAPLGAGAACAHGKAAARTRRASVPSRRLRCLLGHLLWRGYVPFPLPNPPWLSLMCAGLVAELKVGRWLVVVVFVPLVCAIRRWWQPRRSRSVLFRACPTRRRRKNRHADSANPNQLVRSRCIQSRCTEDRRPLCPLPQSKLARYCCIISVFLFVFTSLALLILFYLSFVCWFCSVRNCELVCCTACQAL